MLERVRYRWLRLRPGAHWPKGADGRDLLRRLNNAARDTQLRWRLTSGRRTNYEQWLAYMDYLRGGTLAAACCSRHYPHPWEDCLRQCESNHCRSRAADTVVVLAGHAGTVDVGSLPAARDALKRHGLCLPVGSGEVWHVEVGDTWRS